MTDEGKALTKRTVVSAGLASCWYCWCRSLASPRGALSAWWLGVGSGKAIDTNSNNSTDAPSRPIAPTKIPAAVCEALSSSATKVEERFGNEVALLLRSLAATIASGLNANGGSTLP